MKKNLNIMVPERLIQLNIDNEWLDYYVIFEFEEAGEVYYAVTDGNLEIAILKENSDGTLGVVSEAEAEILYYVLESFFEEHNVLDKDGNNLFEKWKAYYDLDNDDDDYEDEDY